MARIFKCIAALFLLSVFSMLSYAAEEQVSDFTGLKNAVEVSTPDSIQITVSSMSLTDIINASNTSTTTLIYSAGYSVLTGTAPLVFSITGAEYDFQNIGFSSSSNSTLFSLNSGAALRFLDQANFSNNTSTSSVIFINGSSFYAAGANFSSNSNSDPDAGGVISLNAGSASFSGSSSFSGNKASAGSGGAIYASNNSSLNFEDASFTGNSASQYGGAIYLEAGSSVTFSGTVNFTSNTASNGNGGAIYLYNSSAVFGQETAFTGNNAATGNGGAIFAVRSTLDFSGSSETIFSGNLFTSNSGQGGAIYIATYSNAVFGGEVYFTGNGNTYVFSNNTQGGAIFAGLANLDFSAASKTVFDGNFASFGGALYITNVSTAVFGADTSFSNNLARSDGGAVYATNAALEFDGPGNSFFTGNSAANQGGAIFMTSGASADFGGQTITFDSNISTGSGGAIYADGNSRLNFGAAGSVIFSGNKSLSGDGGAVTLDSSYVDFGGSVIFSGNESLSGNGGAAALYNSSADFGGYAFFQGNKAGAGGGALYINSSGGNNGNVTFSSITVFDSNEASANGGGFFAEIANDYSGSTQDIVFNSDTIFSSNKALSGGGFCATSVIFGAGPMNITFNGSVLFDSNSASGNGGGFYAMASELNFNSGVSFLSNRSQSKGGGFYAEGSFFNPSAMNITFSGDTLFDSNNASSDGGGFYANAASITFDGNVSFDSNTSQANGGAFSVSGSNLSFNGSSLFTSNQALSGGALTILDSNVTFAKNAYFAGNKASDKGGAVYAYADDSQISQMQLNFSNTVFTGNQAGTQGGAIYAVGYATNTVTNFAEININTADNGGGDNKTVFQGNTAGGQSNAFYLDNFSTMNFITSAGASVEMYDSMASTDNAYVVVRGAGDFNMYADSDLNDLYINGGNFNFKNGAVLTVRFFTADSGSTVNMRGNASNRISAGTFNFDGALKIDGSETGNITASAAILGSNSSLDIMTDVTDKNYRQRIYKILGYGTLTGDFSQVTLNDGSSISDLADTYFYNNSDNGWITLTMNGLIKSTSFSGLAGESFNQRQTARTLDNLSLTVPGGSDLDTMITALDSLGYGSSAQRDGLAALSGYFIANVIRSASMQNDSREIYDRIKYQVNDAKNPNGVWVQARGQYTSISSNDNSPDEYRDAGGGVLAGWDKIADASGALGGLFMKYNNQSINQGRNSASAESFGGGIYGGLIKEQWELKAMVSGDYGNFDTSRYIDFAQRTADGNFNGLTLGFDIEGAFVTYVSETVYLRPFAGLEFKNTNYDGFQEKGAGDLSLSVKGDNYSRSLARIGINAVSDAESDFEWYGGVDGQYVLNGDEPQIDSSFGGTNVIFASKGAKEGDIIFGVSGGVSYRFLKNMKTFANLSFHASDSYTDIYGNVGLRYMFLGMNGKKSMAQKAYLH